jgi:hypothetical protein
MGSFYENFSYHKMKLMYQLLMMRDKMVLARSNILFRRRNKEDVNQKVQFQGSKSSYLKNLFAMRVFSNVVQRIVVNIFLVKRPCF